MFFSISKKLNTDFPNHLSWGNFFIDYDNGWTHSENILYKGVDNLGSLVVDNVESFKQSTGTFCILYYTNNEIQIITGDRRKFPLFVNHELFIVSNLIGNNSTNSSVLITENIIIETEYDTPSFEKLNLSDDIIISKINSIIEESIVNFKSQSPFKLYLTGGVDTLVIASILLKHKIPFSLLAEEYVEMDYFLCHNRNKLSKFWAYKDLQHWKQPSVLVSGASGDETLIRNPHAAYLLLKHHNENLLELCEKNINWYHSKYFLKEKHLTQYTDLDTLHFKDEHDLKQWILNRNSVDHQHWHLGNTLLFTPFNNLQLSKLALNLSWPTLRSQILDASVSKKLIELNYPSLTRFLSQSKNVNNFNKLWKVFEGLEKLED